MKKVCMKCYEVYDYDIELKKSQYYNNEIKDDHLMWQFCPKSDCYGKVEDIDDNMVEIIRTLNYKGYKTKYCCGGHVKDTSNIIYILFEKDYKFDIPNGFNFEDNKLYINVFVNSPLLKQIFINKINTILCNWVFELNTLIN